MTHNTTSTRGFTVIPTDYRSISMTICSIQVTWQQSSKHTNKSIISETVVRYRWQCIAESGEIGNQRKILKFLIQEFFDVAKFQLVKLTFYRRKFLTYSGRSSGRIIMGYYSKILVILLTSLNLITY